LTFSARFLGSATLAAYQGRITPFVLDYGLTRARLHQITGTEVGADRAMRENVEGQEAFGRDALPPLSYAARGAKFNVDIFTGHEVVVDGALLGGAQGVVPGLGNVDPRGYRNLFDAARAGDWAKAAAEQDRLADLFEIVYTPNGRVSGGAAGLGAFKTALQLMGVIESNTMSTPMPSLNEDETTAIKVILERNGLI